MTENYQHYITRNIRAVYRRRLIAPALSLLLLGLLWFLLSLGELLLPPEAGTIQELEERSQYDSGYVQATLKDLYFTGYTSTAFGRTTGYYYYTFPEDTGMLVLLSPATCEEGLPYMESLHIYGRVIYQPELFRHLTSLLAKDLDWTAQGLEDNLSAYILSEPDMHPALTVGLCLVSGAIAIYALASMLLCALYILIPTLSPPCRQLGRFGKPAELLAQAEEELATLPQLATEDMFITEHYFIEIASSGIAIAPIQEMIWIYKYSTLHKLFWYHFNISYTLYITLNRHVCIQCPKNIKSDIDGIIDYLAEANHGTLVGFSEENRLKVQELQGTSRMLERMVALLKRRY